MNIDQKFDEMVELIGCQELGYISIENIPMYRQYEARMHVDNKVTMWFEEESFKDLKSEMVEWFYGNEWDVKLGGLK
jgi:hypothetical protein